ncbi:MAG: radical SAM protein [Campylobacterota bacterium]|nr:radical SAM protein [Campylobacterota bacterium]
MSTLQLNLDTHKLHYHPTRVGEFLDRGDCYPLYMEVSPVGSCNHRCTFCAYDYIGYPNRKLDSAKFLQLIDDISDNGLKSMLYAGEGEPLMHPNIGEFITYTKKKGIDVGLFTNGELLEKKLNDEIFKSLTFIRFSVNAGDKQIYKDIHKKDVFEKIINNIKYSVKLKKDNNLDTTLGIQFVLLPENIKSVENIVKIASEIGVDYISIKPFVQQSSEQFYQMERQFELQELQDLFEKLEQYNHDSFNIVARVNAFKNYGKRDYKNCFGCNFITVLNSAGELGSCLPYWDKKEYIYGNINTQNFNEIWNGKKRKKIKYHLENTLDATSCPPNCRPNNINSYLYEMKNPMVSHLNFI